jgi:hypothetical protein
VSEDAATIWSQVLPEVRKGVTGVGVWAALNACRPIAMEDGTLVVGISHQDSELSGHLRVPSTKRLIEDLTSKAYGKPIQLRVIEGTAVADWETAKRRDSESRRLQEQALAKAKAEVAARSSWDTIYEQLGRNFASVPNKSLPQNRARFLSQSIRLLADARKGFGEMDDLAERTFARCLERVAQYSEVPSTVVAQRVLEAAGEA